MGLHGLKEVGRTPNTSPDPQRSLPPHGPYTRIVPSASDHQEVTQTPDF